MFWVVFWKLLLASAASACPCSCVCLQHTCTGDSGSTCHEVHVEYTFIIMGEGRGSGTEGAPTVYALWQVYSLVLDRPGEFYTSIKTQVLFKLVQGSQFEFLDIFYTKSIHRRNLSFKHEIIQIGKIVVCYLQPISGVRCFTTDQSLSWNFWTDLHQPFWYM